jgi:bacterioferritin
MNEPFRVDIEEYRRRAREQMEQGAVTSAYHADRERVISVLNEALATEIVCVLRYKAHYFMASGAHGDTAATEFAEHAVEEQLHADRIAERIIQLGGVPNLDPASLTARSHSQYHSSTDLREMLREDLVAERVAISTYSEIVRWLGNDDPTTRRMMEEILATEEEHAEDLVSLLGLHEKGPHHHPA